MTRGFLFLVLLTFLLVSCGQSRIHVPPATPIAIKAYKELPLPVPVDSTSDGAPPPTWLIVGKHVTPASYAGYTTAHLSTVPQPTRPDIATAELPAETPSIIIFGASTILRGQVTVRPWNGIITPLFDPAARELQAEVQHDANVTVFHLLPANNGGDQLLHFAVTFPVQPVPAIGASGEAHYVWRLNPAP
jgi:hypothetical protein